MLLTESGPVRRSFKYNLGENKSLNGWNETYKLLKTLWSGHENEVNLYVKFSQRRRA
jgi:hypothetical protein